MKNMGKRSSKKKASIIAAVTAAIMLLLTGTYAWYDFSQSAVNVFSGNKKEKPSVELVDDFDPDDVEPGANVNKDVYVKNKGNTNLFVRIKLQEYIDLTSTNPGTDWTTHIPDSSSVGDCNASQDFHDYFEWVLGNKVISMTDYNAKSNTEKETYAGWVIDTDGYAYWSQPLAAGAQTDLLLDAIKVSSDLEEYDFYYAINVSMEAVTIGELTMWTTGAEVPVGSGRKADKATVEGIAFINNIAEYALPNWSEQVLTASTWTNSNQSAVNVFSGVKVEKPSVKLIDVFDPDDVEPGKEVNKDIYVKNTGNADLFVRIKLQEYIDLTSSDPGTGWTTHIPDSSSVGDCNATQDFHEYFEWVMGDKVISMTEYCAKSLSEQDAYVGWVYDSDGYAYWSQPLGSGSQTDFLMDAVKVSSELEDYDFYYAVNVLMEAVDIDDLPMWLIGAESADGLGREANIATNRAMVMLENMVYPPTTIN